MKLTMTEKDFNIWYTQHQKDMMRDDHIGDCFICQDNEPIMVNFAETRDKFND